MAAGRGKRVVAGRRLPAAPKDGFEPGRERAGAERLRQEVIGAELEHPHLIILVPFSGEDDDRDGGGGGARPQVRQHSVAVEPGQVQIEHDDVRPYAVDLVERLYSVAGLRNAVAVPLEQVTHHLPQAVLVVHQQHLYCKLTVRPRHAWPRRLLQQVEMGGERLYRGGRRWRGERAGGRSGRAARRRHAAGGAPAAGGRDGFRRGVPLGIHGFSRSGGASIQTSLHVGQSLRISRCATTPRNAAAILYASTPMSTRRVTAFAASLVCRVESTRCPVSDACTAICAVSRSRISPTSTTLGS